MIVSNIESSLDAVESILGAVLEISRLDTGALKPSITTFSLDELLRQIETDFQPLAKSKGLVAADDRAPRCMCAPTEIFCGG